MAPVRGLFRARPRLVIAVVAGIAAGLLLPPDWNVVTRVLAAWNIVAWSYLCMMAWLMTRAAHSTVRQIAEREDETAAAVVTIISTAALLSVAAIVLELADIKSLPPQQRALHYLFTAATLLGSWCMVGIIFAVHYAHMYYRAAEKDRPLRFPNDEHNPDYWDFLYFSFTIAVAAQTSDVTVLSRPMRKAVLAQSVLCFFFNAAVIGLSINIAAGVIGSS